MLDSVAKNWFKAQSNEAQIKFLEARQEMINQEKEACKRAGSKGWFHLAQQLNQSIAINIMELRDWESLYKEIIK